MTVVERVSFIMIGKHHTSIEKYSLAYIYSFVYQSKFAFECSFFNFT